MRRTVTEILRRGFESMLANWQLLLIRIAESVFLIMIAIAGALAVIVPILFSIGFDPAQFQNANNPADLIREIIMGHLLVIIYVLLMITAVLIAFVGVHSFVVAGCARVYVDAERKTGPVAAPVRNDFRAFTGERWLDGGAKRWWTVFWIYNIAWGFGGLIMLIPITLVLALMLLLHENAAAAVIAGCIGLVICILFMIPVAIVMNIWVEKAIVDCVARNSGADTSLRNAWSEMISDAGRHIAVAAVMFGVTMAASTVFSTFSTMGGFSSHSGLNIMLMPVQFSASIANGIVSAAVGAWFLASFAALAVESR